MAAPALRADALPAAALREIALEGAQGEPLPRAHTHTHATQKPRKTANATPQHANAQTHALTRSLTHTGMSLNALWPLLAAACSTGGVATSSALDEHARRFVWAHLLAAARDGDLRLRERAAPTPPDAAADGCVASCCCVLLCARGAVCARD